jgi:hypothetical protein
MNGTRLLGNVALTAALLLTAGGALALDESKYPDLKGQWDRVGVPNWTPAGPPPLTPEYKAVYEANRADMVNGGPGGVPSQYCFPQGMPMMMNIYDPREIVITSDITYILISHVNDSYRRIYTDGAGHRIFHPQTALTLQWRLTPTRYPEVPALQQGVPPMVLVDLAAGIANSANAPLPL